VNAVAAGGAAGEIPLGWVRSGNCSFGAPGLCASAPMFNSWGARWSGSGGAWTGEPVASALDASSGHLFRLLDPTATLGCGFVRTFGAPAGGECMDHAVVFVDPLHATDVALDIHEALPLDVDRPRSRAAAVADAVNGGFAWWVAGAAYSYVDSSSATLTQFNQARGTVWQGRINAETLEYEWCGRQIDQLCVNSRDEIWTLALTDILPGGGAIGISSVQSIPAVPPGWGTPGGKLVLFTASADYNGDLAVNGADLGALLAVWGTSSPSMSLDCDGDVDGADLGILMSMWTSDGAPPKIAWNCSGWTTIAPIEAAGVAARLMQFDDLDALGDFLAVLPACRADEWTAAGALLTRTLLEGGAR
jgi:hypothetical protein